MKRQEALTTFLEIFGKPAEYLYTAAGRINVIGEHVDYCGGKIICERKNKSFPCFSLNFISNI